MGRHEEDESRQRQWRKKAHDSGDAGATDQTEVGVGRSIWGRREIKSFGPELRLPLSILRIPCHAVKDASRLGHRVAASLVVGLSPDI